MEELLFFNPGLIFLKIETERLGGGLGDFIGLLSLLKKGIESGPIINNDFNTVWWSTHYPPKS